MKTLTAVFLLQVMTAADLDRLTAPPPEARITFGDDRLQFGELRLPEGNGPHPVAIVIHGGCWLERYDMAYMGTIAEALTREGIAAWVLEYRRVGNPGGGWPGTFEDIANGADHLRRDREGISAGPRSSHRGGPLRGRAPRVMARGEGEARRGRSAVRAESDRAPRCARLGAGARPRVSAS